MAIPRLIWYRRHTDVGLWVPEARGLRVPLSVVMREVQRPSTTQRNYPGVGMEVNM